MCAGISFPLEKIKEEELKSFYTPKEWQEYKNSKIARTYFWQKRPFLPIEENGEVRLYDWGNRDSKNDFPKTGWAKIESLRKGSWDWLNPLIVKIPSTQGCEKQKWFATPGGMQGIKVHQGKQIRIYMLTCPADVKYLKLTGHERMPLIINN
jgi:hypothetical protein